MKKALITISGLVVVGGGLLAYIGEENRDRFNPLVKEKDVYVLTKGQGEPDPAYSGKRYMYMLNGVDGTGNEDEIKIGTSVKNIGENKYLKVRAKGKYVFSYEDVEEKDVPEKAKEKLKK